MSTISVPAWAEQTVIIIVNIFVSFAAGSATEARKFRQVSKVAPIFPIISQFVMQPLLVAGLCRGFGLDPYFTVGMILCATTPGGNGSNIAEVIFGGDVELGIFMTFCSTLVSAAAIPLNFRYLAVPLLPGAEGSEAPVPWQAIGTAAAILIGGASTGCLVRYLDDALGRKLEIWCVRLGVALLIAGVAFAIASTSEIWYLLSWRNFVVGLLIPPWKFLVTYAAARLCKLPERVAQTAAMEAGEQNIAVALAILSLAFEDSFERDLMLSGLMIYTLFNQAIATPIVTLIFWRQGRGRRSGLPITEPQPAGGELDASADAHLEGSAEPPTAVRPPTRPWWRFDAFAPAQDANSSLSRAGDLRGAVPGRMGSARSATTWGRGVAANRAAIRPSDAGPPQRGTRRSARGADGDGADSKRSSTASTTDGSAHHLA
jgi:BASS family bile acid:Na+ symporter